MNTTVSFIVPVQEDIHRVEAIMEAQADAFHADLKTALHLLLSAGGKRIRPALTILAGRMLGAESQRLLTLAAAIEMLHTATLVHDDLIDNSLLRRGLPTLNAHWSPGATVLTGDFVFARAAVLAADTGSVPVIRLFSSTLSVIVNGEITQLFSNRCKVDREGYLFRIYSKTASLFETSAKAAALISPADEQSVERMRAYGYNVGLAFQITDDILDFTSQSETLGKPVGNDLRQGIVTLPVIIYSELHPEDPLAAALRDGQPLPNVGDVERLIENIRTSDAIQRSHAEAVGYVEAALENLRNLPYGPERCALEDLANYIVRREL